MVGFPGGSDSKESTCNAESGFDPWVGKGSLEEGMATHSSILSWRIPWTEEPRGLQSMGLQRHNQATKHSTVIWCLTEFIGLDYDKFLFSNKLFSCVQSPNHVRLKQNCYLKNQKLPEPPPGPQGGTEYTLEET